MNFYTNDYNMKRQYRKDTFLLFLRKKRKKTKKERTRRLSQLFQYILITFVKKPTSSVHIKLQMYIDRL